VAKKKKRPLIYAAGVTAQWRGSEQKGGQKGKKNRQNSSSGPRREKRKNFSGTGEVYGGGESKLGLSKGDSYNKKAGGLGKGTSFWAEKNPVKRKFRGLGTHHMSNASQRGECLCAKTASFVSTSKKGSLGKVKGQGAYERSARLLRPKGKKNLTRPD